MIDPDADDDYMDEEGFDASSDHDKEEPGCDAMYRVCGDKRKYVLDTRVQWWLYKNGGWRPSEEEQCALRPHCREVVPTPQSNRTAMWQHMQTFHKALHDEAKEGQRWQTAEATTGTGLRQAKISFT